MKETVDTDDRNLTDHPVEVMRSGLRNCFAAAAPIATAVLAEGRRCDSAHITPAPSASKLVLFVCTSNTCRSPMAEAIARRWFAERCGCGDEALRDGHGWDIRSAGLTDEVMPSALCPVSCRFRWRCLASEDAHACLWLSGCACTV